MRLEIFLENLDITIRPEFREVAYGHNGQVEGRNCDPIGLVAHLIEHLEPEEVYNGGLPTFDVELAALHKVKQKLMSRFVNYALRMLKSQDNILTEKIEEDGISLRRYSPKKYRSDVVKTLLYLDKFYPGVVPWQKIEKIFSGLSAIRINAEEDIADPLLSATGLMHFQKRPFETNYLNQ